MEETIFRQTAEQLAQLLLEAAVDHESFERPLEICDLMRCRATCCHDGVILSDEEAKILGAEGSGIESKPDGRHCTATVSAEDSEVADDFPPHFHKTRCVFLDPDHRCRWQIRATGEGRPPWYYKPISCWMHPLALPRRAGRPVLTVVSREEDQKRFASFTHCGRTGTAGKPAREILRAELEMLRKLSGRDFYAELNAPPGFSSRAKETTSG